MRGRCVPGRNRYLSIMSPRKKPKTGLEEPSFASTLGWSALVVVVLIVYIRYIW